MRAFVFPIVLLLLSFGQAVAFNPPNIVVLMADDLGYGDLSSTGNRTIQTPNIDRIGDEGVRFSHFYAGAPVCSPSRAAMLTGRLPHRLGIYGFLHTGEPYVHLPRSEVTLPQVLRDSGYQTALVGKWHASLLEFREKFATPDLSTYGFDFSFATDNNTILRDKPGWWRNGQKLDEKIPGLAANVVGAEAERWLRTGREDGQPFLLMVHFFEPHWRVEGREQRIEEHVRAGIENRNEATYYACVENLDSEVGRIDALLEELELKDNTIVLFTSDHGPARLGKGAARNRNFGRAAPYRGWKYGLWDGSIHVPAFLRWPAGLQGGGRDISEPIGAIDLLPSLCRLAGASLPDGLADHLDGTDVTALLDPNEPQPITRRVPLQWYHYNANLNSQQEDGDEFRPNAVLRDGDYVICGFYDHRPGYPGRWSPEHMDYLRTRELVRFALYDVVKDPGQTNDLAVQMTQVFLRLSAALQQAHGAYQAEAVGWKDGKLERP